MTRYKTLSIIFIFIGLSYMMSAQSIREIKAERDTYLWGEGEGSTLKSADQEALVDLIGQISVQVENDFTQLTTEKNKNFSQTVKDVIRTYSTATLRNTERIVLHDEPDAKVFRYVKKTEIDKIFESRRNKIVEFAHNGEQALKNLQIADALRYFYWAQTLLRSNPDANSINMKNTNGQTMLLITWLPKQINEILSNINIRVDKMEEKENYVLYLLDIRFKGEPVRNLDYTYWSGQDWSNIVSAKDGLGVVELPKTQIGTDLRLKMEYVFEGEANIDLELRDVMQRIPLVPYKSNCLTVSWKSTPESNLKKETEPNTPTILATTNAQLDIPAVVQSQPADTAHVGSITLLSQTTDENLILSKVRQAILNKDFTSVKKLFTDQGYELFQKLLQYGNARILRKNPIRFYTLGEYIICRSIPMSFSFKNNDRTFVEDVVFYINKDKKICNLSFGLSEKTVLDIASNASWSEKNRMLIISFLENYKTAYALKRFDYINSIFSDDALIITGYVTKPNVTAENRYANNNIVRFNQQTKSEYMKKLRYSFDSNEFINIRFSDNTIRRSGKGNEIYGIQIQQDYYSMNYGDKGYLFLLVDLSDSEKPIIHVRTWQPEKNPDGSIYGLSDF